MGLPSLLYWRLLPLILTPVLQFASTIYLDTALLRTRHVGISTRFEQFLQESVSGVDILGQNKHRGHARADSGCAVLTHDIFVVPAIADVFPPTPAFHHPCNFGSTAAATTQTSASAQRAPRTTTSVGAQHAPTRANHATAFGLAAPTATCPSTTNAHRLPVISRLVHHGIS